MKNRIPIKSAVISNYKGYVALIGEDNKVYLGKRENYVCYGEDNAYYKNKDKSLIHISDNTKIFSMLYSDGWIYSQQKMIDEGAFTDKDYAEFDKLRKGVLSELDCKHQITFAGIPFKYPVTMTVLVVPPMQKPFVKEIDAGLESLQKEVGGLIEVVYPFEDRVGIICNEDGKFNGMELNRALYTDKGKMYDIIAGTFLVAGLGDEDFISLTDEQQDKFMERFKNPETFVNRTGKIAVGEIISIPLKPSVKDKLKELSDNGKDRAKREQKPPDIEL